MVQIEVFEVNSDGSLRLIKGYSTEKLYFKFCFLAHLLFSLSMVEGEDLR
jgi:hypothetical protein